MISVERAIHFVQQQSFQTYQKEKINLSESDGYFLAEDILSPIHMPPFDQSAMDGYALYLHESNTYIVIDEIKAGAGKNPVLQPGEAVRIFTGAPVPDMANVVVMQEKVVIKDNILIIKESVSIGENIRPLGEQVKKGEVALKKGTKLTPAAIGFLASIGIKKVCVFKKPSIALIATGNELIEISQPLIRGKIYESNNAMLSSALASIGYQNISTFKIEDNEERTYEVLNKMLAKKEVILITGGVSVGDYDFVYKALQKLEVETIFYKVKQKPGKPLFFGKKGNTLVFGLPGNPASALTCFYIYVYPALQKISGESDFKPSKIVKKSVSHFAKRGNRAQFLKAILKDGAIHILEGQSSAMLQSFALANALVYMPETLHEINPGDKVEIIVLPN